MSKIIHFNQLPTDFELPIDLQTSIFTRCLLEMFQLLESAFTVCNNLFSQTSVRTICETFIWFCASMC